MLINYYSQKIHILRLLVIYINVAMKQQMVNSINVMNMVGNNHREVSLLDEDYCIVKYYC